SDFKTLEREYAKDGLSGDALYQKINDDMFNFGCFVAGTLVMTDKGKVPIQDIKVGDLVLSKPEDGIGEPEFKPVLKTFVHEEKPIWMVRASKSPNFFDGQGEEIDYQKYKLVTENIDILATPNHPVWVIGISNANWDITFYERPHWKRVDELLQYEHVVNADGVMYYITDVQPLYRFSHPDVEPNPNHYWYEKNYGKDYYDDYLYGDFEPDLEVTEEDFKTIGGVFNLNNYQQEGLLGVYVENIFGDVRLYNTLQDEQGNFIPFTTTVYNMEVADNHTYFIDDAKLWVHNTNCEEKALKILLGDALYQKINDDMFNFGCFVAGTLVTTDKGKVPIQDIKVGDLVLSKPEDGIGEPEFKPVLKTFVHEDKPIWMVRAEKINYIFNKEGKRVPYSLHGKATDSIDFLATPNHPVWVVGTYARNADPQVSFYDRPHWKRVDELARNEVAVNADGVMYIFI
ncbi:hypothetical protein LVY74_17550, partial [Acinetobacter sp. ME22]|uniref:Hint domain-containing protein n=1 Tax=Acinetobacter sp. ME22 TaxID=2904802 RepID=UPI001EDAE423